MGNGRLLNRIGCSVRRRSWSASIPIMDVLRKSIGSFPKKLRDHALGSPGQEYISIRLAYVHNWGDVAMSCVPVIAGVLITLSTRGVFDAAMALGVTVWMCWS